MKLKLICFLFIWIFFYTENTFAQRNIYTDSLALVNFYNNAGGSGWPRHIRWDLNSVLPSWSGVVLNDDGRVSRLDLLSFNINGSLTDSIGVLDELVRIYMNKNDLSGKLPDSLFSLKKLNYLHLGTNIITGTIAPEIGNLIELKTLYLYRNRFNGKIPSSIGNLRKLEWFSLNYNQLVGEIPESVYDLTNLKLIGLGNNLLTGEISYKIGNLKKLECLYYENCQFTGALPNEINELNALKILALDRNFIEELPKITISNLDSVTCNYNRLSFEDILPNLNCARKFIYSPQDSIGTKQNLHLTVGETFEYNLGIDSGITSNQYIWKKDGAIIAINNQNKLILNYIGFQDAGIYTCEVRNPNVPDLILHSRSVKLTIDSIRLQKLPKLYPNPSNGIFYLQLDLEEESDIKTLIYNPLGDLVQESDFQNIGIFQDEITLDLQNLNNGIYFLELWINGQSIRRKTFEKGIYKDEKLNYFPFQKLIIQK